jgi:hypothetical protein
MSPELNDGELEDPEGIDAWEAIKLRAPPMSPEDEARLQAFLDSVRRPLAKGDPRKHHYIPEFFQRRFATADEQLAVVPLQGDEYKVRHVSHIAVMKDLYTTIDSEIGETVAVERILAQADGDAAGVISGLLGDGFPPSPEGRASLAIWLGLLRVRDPHSRRSLEALADSTYKMDLSLVANPDAARARLRENLDREPTDEEVNELVNAANDLDSFEVVPHQNQLVQLMLDSALAMAPHLFRRLYAIVRFPEPGLVLCDRPLMLYQHPENRRASVGVGIINADELWLPLDRSNALILHNDPSFSERIIDAPPEHGVDDFNQAVVLNAVAEVYCHPADVERLADLEFPEPDKPLMQITGGDWMKGGTDGVNEPPRRKRHRRYRRGE